MSDMTTVKLPKTLRDRLAERARRDHTTLAGAIAQAVDESDERQFWRAVRSDHASVTDDERQQRNHQPVGTDNLIDADDDALTSGNAW